MKTITIKFLTALLIFIFSQVYVQPAFAHGDDARIEISAERLNPGSVMDIRGVDFERDAEVVLTLVGPQAELPLGKAIADVEGVFFLTFTLPVDLAEGAYTVRGTLEDDHNIDSPSFTVSGSADLGSTDGEPRAEEDSLLAPMPTLAAGVPTPQLSSMPATQTPPENKSLFQYAWQIALAGILVLTILILKFSK